MAARRQGGYGQFTSGGQVAVTEGWLFQFTVISPQGP